MVISTTDSDNIQQEKTGYLYRHIRLDTNMPFYIGISSVNNGKYERAYVKCRNNAEWHKVINETDYRVEIMLENIPVSILDKKEKYFIKLYGRIDLGTGTLVNKTSGGQGTNGLIFNHTDETKKIMSDKKKGYKQTPEHIEKIRKANIGRKASEEHKKKIGESNKGKIRSEEAKRKMSDSAPKKPVGQYKDGILIKEYPSIKATRLDGFIYNVISACCSGKRKSHGGFQWKFLYDSF